jgi:O-antigen/teichoic acid export membrane protein
MSVQRNILANFAGKAWTALMALAFLPLHVSFLGIEAYGLIGFFVSFMALFSVLDMGLSTTLSKELARLSGVPGAEQTARNLTRTFELIYWGVGILIGCAVAVTAPFIAGHWLSVQDMDVATVEHAIMAMGLAVALQWPTALYSGGLMGLQRQVSLNSIRVVAATLQGVGTVLVLWLVSPTILAYFSWQILIGAVQTAVLAWLLWDSLPSSSYAAFRKDLLIGNWRFAGGMALIALLVAILTQADKIVLSKLLSLEMFGYYTLAAVIGSALNYISNPIFNALFPRFAQEAGAGNAVELTALYHKGSQLMAACVAPMWIFLALFAEDILSIWFGDAPVVSHTHLLVSLLATGTALNAFMTLPYALQLAHGWTSLSVYKNVVSVALLIPLLLWLIAHHGTTGAALAWIALNAGYFLFEIPLLHRRLLKKDMGRWYAQDVAIPVAVCLGIGLVARVAMPGGLPKMVVFLWILAAFALASVGTALSMHYTREWLKSLVFPRLNIKVNF